jgi:hypothetical protein
VRTLRFPKPKKEDRAKRKSHRQKKASQKTSRRKAPPRMPAALDSYRERVKYANDLWRRIIRTKEPTGLCPSCRRRKWVDAAHGWPKGPYPWMRFELTNGIPLCRVCHRRVDSDFAAKTELWVRYYGRPECDRLHVMSQFHGKLDMLLVIMFLEREVAKLDA